MFKTIAEHLSDTVAVPFRNLALQDAEGNSRVVTHHFKLIEDDSELTALFTGLKRATTSLSGRKRAEAEKRYIRESWESYIDRVEYDDEDLDALRGPELLKAFRGELFPDDLPARTRERIFESMEKDIVAGFLGFLNTFKVDYNFR